MLFTSICQLKSDTRSCTDNPILLWIKEDWLKSIDNSSDNYVISMRKKMERTLKGVSIEYSSKHESFYDDYSEVTLYLYLQSKGLAVSRIPEKKDKTPDFKVSFGSETVFIENKCIKPMNPQYNLKVYQYQVLKRLYDLAAKFKIPGVHFGEPVCYQPYLPNDQTKYSSVSNLLVINSIIEKIEQNLKRGQITDNTILNIDLSLLGLNSIPTSSAFIYDTQDDIIINAPLWTSCFGVSGMPIFQYEFAPNGNLEGHLLNDGVLVKNDYLKAMSFRIDPLSDVSVFIGFANTYCDLLQDILAEYCSEVNTNKNVIYECFKQ
ncbi:hypothetical protein MASR2M64_07490 [Candidatus Cloacimonadota bacterium]|jgi:hypothetical protein